MANPPTSSDSPAAAAQAVTSTDGEAANGAESIAGQAVGLGATGAEWGLDYEAIRRGDFSDAYFEHVRNVLKQLSSEGYEFEATTEPHDAPSKPRSAGVLAAGLMGREASGDSLAPVRVNVGDLHVDMQVFTRREPFTIVAGLPVVLDLLRHCTGSYDDDGQFVNAFDQLTIRAVAEGSMVEPWEPVMRIRGPYKAFCLLETVMLGVLARASRIATNTYKAITATRGKPIAFLSARFDHPADQPLDGYAYSVGLGAYSLRTGIETSPLVATRAHARNWGREDGAGMSHSYVLCFLRDTPQAMIEYARIVPPDVPRVAVVDANNDCVADSVETARRMFEQYQHLLDEGREKEAARFKLYAVRPDTSRNMRDRQIEPLGDPRLDCGVTPRLVHLIREALDQAPLHMNVPLSWMESCRRYFREIKIFVTGGFDPDRIRLFENLQVPVDLYGIGSYLIRGKSNDYTADVVEVETADGRWVPMAKAGRGPRESPQLRDAGL